MDKRRKNPWSEEYDEEDRRPEDYELHTAKAEENLRKKESPNATRLDEQDKNGKYCSYYDYPADYGREK